ncbi:hypothetical protein FN846DRAFT_908330, partial [Sphaerosporella brunnea]
MPFGTMLLWDTLAVGAQLFRFGLSLNTATSTIPATFKTNEKRGVVVGVVDEVKALGGFRKPNVLGELEALKKRKIEMIT